MSEMTSEYRHTPVLLAECLEQLTLQTQHTFVDATLGGAGHSLEMAKLIGQAYHCTAPVASVNKPVTKDENGPPPLARSLSRCRSKPAPRSNCFTATSGNLMDFSPLPRCPESTLSCSISVFPPCRSIRRHAASPLKKKPPLTCGWIRVHKLKPQQRSSTPTTQQISLGSSVLTRTRSGRAASRTSS